MGSHAKNETLTAPAAGHLRVLRVLSHLGSGGTERQALEIAAAINEDPSQAVQIDVATFCGPPGHDHVLAPPPTCRWHRLEKPWSPTGMVTAARELAPLLSDYDCVHALLWPALWVVALARRRDVPLVASIHSSSLPQGPLGLKKQVDRLAISSARRVVFNSEAGRCGLSAHFRLDPARTTVIGNGKALYHGPWPTRKGITCLARVAAPKRHDLLLAALARIDPDQRPLLTCAGEGTDDSAFATRLQALGGVIGVGHVADPLERLAGSVLAVLPTDHEGLPNVILEAWNTGTPILASRVPGVADLVRDGHDGILVENTPHAWATAIAESLADRDQRQRLAAAGRKRLEQEFAPGPVAKRWCDLYRDVVRGRVV